MFHAITLIGLILPGPLPAHKVVIMRFEVTTVQTQHTRGPSPKRHVMRIETTARSRTVRPVKRPSDVKHVVATGIGRPPPNIRGGRARLMAKRAAEVIAVRNLARKLGLGSRATVRGFRYLPAKYLPDGRVEVTVVLNRSR